MAPRRRLALAVIALLALVSVVVGVVLVRGPSGGSSGSGGAASSAGGGAPAVDQAQQGVVLLVPGYGGGTDGLAVLAAALVAAGRDARVVGVAGDGTGDLADQADELQAAAAAAVADGAPSVDVVGYSAGGVVARIWLDGAGAREPVRRVLTLGSPHQGTDLAAFAARDAPQQCPLACQQLEPGSDLLTGLPAVPGAAAGVRWTSVWSASDEVVVPPADASSLRGAVDVELQQVCAGVQVGHGQLVTSALAVGVVDAALDGAPLTAAPSASDCDALTARGQQLLS